MSSCNFDFGYPDDYATTLEDKDVVARKNHKCFECGSTISRGDKYWFFKGVYDGNVFTIKTCNDCRSMSRLFKTGYEFGTLRESVSECIKEFGHIPEECLTGVTDEARKFMIGCLDVEETYS